jgi:hypothetical protein
MWRAVIYIPKVSRTLSARWAKHSSENLFIPNRKYFTEEKLQLVWYFEELHNSDIHPNDGTCWSDNTSNSCKQKSQLTRSENWSGVVVICGWWLYWPPIEKRHGCQHCLQAIWKCADNTEEGEPIEHLAKHLQANPWSKNTFLAASKFLLTGTPQHHSIAIPSTRVYHFI